MQDDPDFDADISDSDDDELSGLGNKGGENDKEEEEAHSKYNPAAICFDTEAGEEGGKNDEEQERDSRNGNEYDYQDSFIQDNVSPEEGSSQKSSSSLTISVTETK